MRREGACYAPLRYPLPVVCCLLPAACSFTVLLSPQKAGEQAEEATGGEEQRREGGRAVDEVVERQLRPARTPENAARMEDEPNRAIEDRRSRGGGQERPGD